MLKKTKKTTGLRVHIPAMSFPSYLRHSEAAAAIGMTTLVGILSHQAGRFEC